MDDFDDYSSGVPIDVLSAMYINELNKKDEGDDELLDYEDDII